MIYIGIDNGVSGSIGVLDGEKPAVFLETPVREVLDFTKVAQKIHRINVPELMRLLEPYSAYPNSHCVMERPLKNPRRFQATYSAARAYEATLIALEELGTFAISTIDSRVWQSVMLPSGLKGAPALKKASMQRGIELFPHLADAIRKHKDADGLLMAAWARQRGTL